jgi:hypothetical protein
MKKDVDFFAKFDYNKCIYYKINIILRIRIKNKIKVWNNLYIMVLKYI